MEYRNWKIFSEPNPNSGSSGTFNSSTIIVIAIANIPSLIASNLDFGMVVTLLSKVFGFGINIT